MDKIIQHFICLLLCLGIFIMLRGSILYLISSIFYKERGAWKTENRLRKHLRQIFKVISNGKHIDEKITAFVLISIVIMVVMGSVMFRTFGVKGIFIASGMAAMPYAYIRARLAIKQMTGSFEGEMLVDEILNQYKICDFNIYETIDRCVISLGEETLSKKALFQLALKLHSYSGDEELREALRDFTANWDTVWARMVADNIYNAVKEEVNVLHGLESILMQCKEINSFIEENKKDGMETDVLVKILCPLFFFILLWMAKNMMGYSWNTLLKYEFAEKTGLMIFSILVFLSALNIIVFPLLGKKKYDF